MDWKDAWLKEFDFEMEKTRRTLERVPEDKLDWRPHSKSLTMGALATHLAQIPGWAATALTTNSFDLAPEGSSAMRLVPLTSRKEILDLFDKNRAAARAAVADATAEHLQQEWTLQAGGQIVFRMPRTVVLRSFIMNHSIHHRAQLGVYLRLNEVAVPSIYGPSADEPTM
jgi:uncharacterized damage-inducible protein DinB